MNNIKIKCKCGCGTIMDKFDKWKRPRKFLSGHNTPRKYDNPTQYKREWNHRNRKERYEYKVKYYRKRKAVYLEYMGNKCTHCGIEYNGKNAPIFHFHHMDASKKEFAVGNMIVNFSQDTIKKELDKCALLCANCHEMEHSAEF